MSTTLNPHEPMIGSREAARMLGVHVNTVMKKVHAKEIPHMRIGSRVLFLASILDDWRRQQIQSSVPCVAAKEGMER